MADKDVTEKTLEGYSDVFADIVNVLLFHGKQFVKETELEDETPRSIYKADGKLHEQERDVAKYWKDCSVRIALYGLENQTEAERDMPLRVISYDGAAYRGQLLKDKEKEPKPKVRYPVVTLVLYFGYEKHSDQPLSLTGCLEIPEVLQPFVKDYGINLFEIAWLTDEQVELFQSDFKIVADYFVQMRKNHSYKPSRETIRHVDELLKLMTVLTQDKRFEDVINQSPEEGKVRNMCEVLNQVEARGWKRGRDEGRMEGRAEGRMEGRAEGRKEGRAEGRDETLLQNIQNLMVNLKMTAEQVMNALCIPGEEQPKYLAMLKK